MLMARFMTPSEIDDGGKASTSFCSTELAEHGRPSLADFVENRVRLPHERGWVNGAGARAIGRRVGRITETEKKHKRGQRNDRGADSNNFEMLQRHWVPLRRA